MKRNLVPILILLVLLTFSLYSYAEDTTPPDTTITSGPSGEIDYRDVTFEWTGSDNVTATSDLTYSYMLEGVDSDWSNWTYDTSKSYSDMRNGDYTFKVKARDEAGNMDSSPSTTAFTVEIVEPGAIKWTYETEYRMTSNTSLAFGHNDLIYFAEGGRLYAFSKNTGTLQWKFETGYNTGTVTPTVGPDGTIYVYFDGLGLYAITEEGNKKWKVNIGDVSSPSPAALGPNGTIYLAGNLSGKRKLYAISPDGTYKWSFNTNESTIHLPAVGLDGIIYVGTFYSLYALTSKGNKKWIYEINPSSPGVGTDFTPAISSSGTIITGSYNKTEGLHAIRQNGTKIWDTKMGGAYSPIIDADGTIYVVTGGGRLVSVNQEGTIVNETISIEVESSEYNCPAFATNGTIYLGSRDGKLYAFDSSTLQKEWTFDTGSAIGSSPLVGNDGTIYVVSGSQKIYAIYGTSNGLADSPWPMFQRNPQHTGNISKVNLPPKAEFTYSPSEPNPGDAVTFDASPSSDSDGNIAQYQWDWNDDGTYEDTLSSPTIEHSFSTAGDYSVTLKVIDNEDASDTTTKTVSATAPEDTTPPDPNPMTWKTEPHATGINEITMEATSATDPEENGVEYYFEETTGNSGADDSSWQSDNAYSDSDLEVDTQYCYRVKARDKSPNQNETDWSDEACSYAGLTTSLAAGWNLFSPPGIPQNPDPETALGDDIELFALFYDYSPGEGYTAYPDDTASTQLTWKKGYWTYLSAESQVDMVVDVPNQNHTLEFVEQGWNMIGVPYSVDWSQANFSDPADFETDGAGNVRLVSWDPTNEVYLNHYSGDSYGLGSWRGYWVKVKQASSSEPASMTVSKTIEPPPPPGSQTPLPQSVDRDQLDYPPLPQELEDNLRAFAYPNPVIEKGQVTFTTRTPDVEEIKVTVTNMAGEQIYNSEYESGDKLTWNLKDVSGNKVANGIYLYKIQVTGADGTTQASEVKRLLVLR